MNSSKSPRKRRAHKPSHRHQAEASAAGWRLKLWWDFTPYNPTSLRRKSDEQKAETEQKVRGLRTSLGAKSKQNPEQGAIYRLGVGPGVFACCCYSTAAATAAAARPPPRPKPKPLSKTSSIWGGGGGACSVHLIPPRDARKQSTKLSNVDEARCRCDIPCVPCPCCCSRREAASTKTTTQRRDGPCGRRTFAQKAGETPRKSLQNRLAVLYRSIIQCTHRACCVPKWATTTFIPHTHHTTPSARGREGNKTSCPESSAQPHGPATQVNLPKSACIILPEHQSATLYSPPPLVLLPP